ncbi:MAG: hypothetical protein K9M81_01505 [Chthoniobacterales bacterium]|nr:hypothetical protein [Chthoniobacterales bacterium]
MESSSLLRWSRIIIEVGSRDSYSPRSNSKLTQYPSGVRKPQQNQYEICGLDSHFDLDSMYTYSPASKCSSALPHQPSRSPRYDQYEISGLKDNSLTFSQNRNGVLKPLLEC